MPDFDRTAPVARPSLTKIRPQGFVVRGGNLILFIADVDADGNEIGQRTVNVPSTNTAAYGAIRNGISAVFNLCKSELGVQ